MLKYIGVIIISICLWLIHFLKKRIPKNIIWILRTICIVALLEITIFNINAYRTDFGKLEYKKLSEKELEKRVVNTVEGTKYISIEDLNIKVKSIYIELEDLEENQVVDYDIYYSDKSTSNRYLASKSYFPEVEKTKYSAISLSREL